MKNLLKRIRLQRLHIFSDDTTSIVAFDFHDAMKAWEEWTNDKWDDSYDPFDIQLKDTAIITICCEPSDFDDFKKHRPPFSKIRKGNGISLPAISAPAWLWCLWNGRGFLCSTEF